MHHLHRDLDGNDGYDLQGGRFGCLLRPSWLWEGMRGFSAESPVLPSEENVPRFWVLLRPFHAVLFRSAPRRRVMVLVHSPAPLARRRDDRHHCPPRVYPPCFAHLCCCSHLPGHRCPPAQVNAVHTLGVMTAITVIPRVTFLGPPHFLRARLRLASPRRWFPYQSPRVVDAHFPLSTPPPRLSVRRLLKMGENKFFFSP